MSVSGLQKWIPSCDSVQVYKCFPHITYIWLLNELLGLSTFVPIFL